MRFEEVERVLADVAPNISFSTTYVEDMDEVWDGDGPDPAEEGYTAYVAEVRAATIAKGKMIEGEAYLGGHYRRAGEEDPFIGGYYFQMAGDALSELQSELRRLGHREPGLVRQIKDAKDALRRAAEAFHAEVDRERARRRHHGRKQAWNPRRRKGEES